MIGEYGCRITEAVNDMEALFQPNNHGGSSAARCCEIELSHSSAGTPRYLLMKHRFYLFYFLFTSASSLQAIDLTKEAPPDTKRPYNLGPTVALGWMQVDHGMTEGSRQILITEIEKGSPGDGKLEVGDVFWAYSASPSPPTHGALLAWRLGRQKRNRPGADFP